jgi:hypothetical protein
MGTNSATCSVLSPCGPSVWMEPSTAQAELADAKERQAQADIAISAARTLLQEAEQAKQAAQSRRSDAETKVRSAHYATVDCVASAPLGKAEAAAALCASLSLSMEAVREADSLKADRRSLGGDGAEGLAYLLAGSSMPRLEVLTLSCNALGDLGVATLADALSLAIPLRHLDLASNSVGAVGTAALAHAMNRGALPKLTGLVLKNNDINDQGALALAKAPHERLEWLSLSRNQISEEGALALAAPQHAQSPLAGPLLLGAPGGSGRPAFEGHRAPGHCLGCSS